MKHQIGLAMFSHCGYDKMLDSNYSIEFNESLNYDLEPFIVSENPPDFHFLKENNCCCHLNSCLSLFTILKKPVNEIISSDASGNKLKYLINILKKIQSSKRYSSTNHFAVQLNFNMNSTIYNVYEKIMYLIPEPIKKLLQNGILSK